MWDSNQGNGKQINNNRTPETSKLLQATRFFSNPGPSAKEWQRPGRQTPDLVVSQSNSEILQQGHGPQAIFAGRTEQTQRNN
jgi:hypothetical protein